MLLKPILFNYCYLPKRVHNVTDFSLLFHKSQAVARNEFPNLECWNQSPWEVFILYSVETSR